jgi:putative chitinase
MSFWSRLLGRAPALPINPPDLKTVTIDRASESGAALDWPDILKAAGFAQPVTWAAAIAPAAARRGINTPKRAAAFAATIAHESNGGARLVESLNYSPKGLLATWPSRFSQVDADMLGRRLGQEADQRAIAERAYGGRMGNGPEGSGDGFKYRGRGLIQITGRDAYRQAGDAIGLTLVAAPELALDPKYSSEIAAWTWATWKGCNAMADADNVTGWRRAINGGLNGLADVKARYEAALKAAA